MDFNEGWLFKSYCTRKASLGRHFVSLYDWWFADMNGWNTFQSHWNVDLQATSSNITCYSGDRHEPLHYSGWHITSDCSAIVIKVKCFPKHDERWLWMDGNWCLVGISNCLFWVRISSKEFFRIEYQIAHLCHTKTYRSSVVIQPTMSD